MRVQQAPEQHTALLAPHFLTPITNVLTHTYINTHFLLFSSGVINNMDLKW